MSVPKLYFVTPEVDEDFGKWKLLIENVIAGGVDIIQIRDKKSSKQKLFTAIKEIQPLLKNANIPMIINDYVDLAYALNAEGVHLGQSDLKVCEARAVLGDNAIIGLSIETIVQAIVAQDLHVNYLAASPVFDSNTKPDCSKPWGIAGLKQLCAMSCHPIFAIGGINLNNIESILECKVEGIAIVSAIAKAQCPKRATEEFIEKMRQYAY